MNGFKEIYNDTWVMEDGGVRIFLAAGKEKALVIDTGMTGLDIHNIYSRKVAEKSGFKLLETRMYKDIGDEKEELYRFYGIKKNS